MKAGSPGRGARCGARAGALLSICLAGVVNCTAHAQALVPLESATLLPAQTTAPATPPGGIPVGPLIVYPAIDVAVGHNDNLFSSNINREGSAQTTISPSVKAEGRIGPHRFDVLFRLDDVRYASSPADNYANYSVLATGDIVFSGRAGLKVRGEYRHGVDPRGSTDRTVSATPDEYIHQGIEGVFGYGATGAKGRIEVDGAAYSRRYQNNRLATAPSDRDTTQVGATFLLRVAPKTQLLVSAQQRWIEYVVEGSTQSSTENRYQVGAKWEATAKTTGILKFGYLEKRFDNVGRTGFGGPGWDAVVRWSPLTYSVFDFTTSKTTNESTGTGDYLLSQLYGVSWNHAWNSRLSSAATTGWRKDAYEGTGGGRVDKTSTLGLNATYQWQRWIRLGAAYTFTDRVSSPSTFDFTRHLWMFTVGATL